MLKYLAAFGVGVVATALVVHYDIHTKISDFVMSQIDEIKDKFSESETPETPSNPAVEPELHPKSETE